MALDASGDIIGGLVGGNNGTIVNCYSTVEVNVGSNGDAGGLIGRNSGSGVVTGCYATGERGGDRDTGMVA